MFLEMCLEHVVWQKSWLLRYSQIFLEKNFISFIFLLTVKNYRIKYKKDKKDKKIIIKEINYQKEF